MTRESRWALAALAAILVITAGWWTLALWPLPSTTPDWVLRTRAVCFGAAPDGLPHGGGWVLLIGEPIGMLGFLLIVWGSEVREGLAALARRWPGRLAMTATSLALVVGLAAATARVADAKAGLERFDPTGGSSRGGRSAPLVELGQPAPALDLRDQRGARVTIEQFRGRPVIVTFAYAHCETVCPIAMRDALEAGRSTQEGATPAVVIVTLDPWRDTPSRLPAIVSEWGGLAENAHLLSGPVDDVEQVLNRWKVPRVRNEATGELIHPVVTYLVAPGGELAYLTDGTPAALELGLSRMR